MADLNEENNPHNDREANSVESLPEIDNEDPSPTVQVNTYNIV